MNITMFHVKIILVLFIVFLGGCGKLNHDELSMILDRAFDANFPKEFTVIKTKRDDPIFGNITYTIQLSSADFDLLIKQIEKSKYWKPPAKSYFKYIGTKKIIIPGRRWERIDEIREPYDFLSMTFYDIFFTIANVQESSKPNVTLYLFEPD